MLYAISKGRHLGEEVVNLKVGEPVIVTIVTKDHLLPGLKICLEEVCDEALRQTNDPDGEHPDEHKLLGRMEMTVEEHHLTQRVLTTEFRWPTGFKNTGIRRMDLVLRNVSNDIVVREVRDALYFDVTLQSKEDIELERMLKQQRRRNLLLNALAFLIVMLFSGIMGHVVGREEVRNEKIEDALAASGETFCQKCPVVLSFGTSMKDNQTSVPTCPPPPICECPEKPVPTCPITAPAIECPPTSPPVACPPTPTCSPPPACPACETCEVCESCEVCPEPFAYNECENLPVCEEPFVYNECETMIPQTSVVEKTKGVGKQASKTTKKNEVEDLEPGSTFYH